MIFSRLADRFVLCPSRQPIKAPKKRRQTVACDGKQVEVWIERTCGPTLANSEPGISDHYQPTIAPLAPPEPQIFVLKFNGAGGRAERTGIHPLELWGDVPGEVWSANPPGYGGSEGTANLQGLAAAARAVFDELLSVAGDRPILVTGNSLGTTSALHVAAHFAQVPNLAGLVLRNPLPLRELIRGQYSWRTLGLAHGVASQIPPELDSVRNASRVQLPCVMHCAGRDRVVPPQYQRLVLDAYAGPKHVVTVDDAGHVFVLSATAADEYSQALTWLRTRMGIASAESRVQVTDG